MEDLLTLRLQDYATDVRVDVLRRLAEQAMSDESFRAVARVDLMDALQQFGYELSERELDLVLRFRDALAEAGIDVFLQEPLDPAYLDLLSRVAG
ncbi:MAG: hypothetical protein AB7G88_11465 [Thermomicrobiales bacterium]